MRRFLRVAASALVLFAGLGLLAGLLYQRGFIGDTGWWLWVLDGVTSWELDKKYLPYLLSGLAYLTAWALYGALAWLYGVGRTLLIKEFLGVAAVGTFFVCAGIQIPAFASLRAVALTVALEGLLLSGLLFWWLPSSVSVPAPRGGMGKARPKGRFSLLIERFKRLSGK